MQNGKGDKIRPYKYKEYSTNFENIEWRTKGTYCEYCGVNLKYPFDKEKHLFNHGNNVTEWVCSVKRECNLN